MKRNWDQRKEEPCVSHVAYSNCILAKNRVERHASKRSLDRASIFLLTNSRTSQILGQRASGTGLIVAKIVYLFNHEQVVFLSTLTLEAKLTPSAQF